MKKSTLFQALLPGIVSFGLVCFSAPAFAQHGGGHAGGGGGSHSGGGGGFHGGGGGSYGGFHGGSYHGGGPAFGGRGLSPGPSGGSLGPRGANAGRPWSWEGHNSRDTSPGWHQFASGGSSLGREGAVNAGHPGASSMPARSASVPTHAAIADGRWHSFATPRAEVARATATTSFNRAGAVSGNPAWHGNYWGGWYGGWGWGWPGWNWGWGFGWGCCGWGFGWTSWTPFWAWPPYYYWYDPSIYAADVPAPYVLDPYPR